MHRYTAAEEQNRLVLTAKEGSMKLFFYKLDDLHQLDFIDNQMMAKENEKLRGFLRTIYQQRESWKHRALAAEGLYEGYCQNQQLWWPCQRPQVRYPQAVSC